jgi:transposase
MDSHRLINDFFISYLHLPEKLNVNEVILDRQNDKINIFIVAKRATKYTCPCCDSEENPVHTRTMRRWRDKDFGDCKIFLNFNLPRVKCPTCGVHTIKVPWARPRSNYTLSFEQHVLDLAMNIPIPRVAKLLDETEEVISRIILLYQHSTEPSELG